MRAPKLLLAIGLAAAVCLLLSINRTLGQTSTPVQTPPQQIRISLIATDRSNRAVEDLRQEEINLVEGDRPQPITFFAKDDRPLRYTIALDTSGSFKSLLPACLSVVIALIENNKPNDETMLVTFVSSDLIEKEVDFTTDKSKLLDSLKLIEVKGGQTAVIDAVHLAVEATASGKPDTAAVRQVVILISDGEDRYSFYTQDQLLKLLREKDVQIFIIGIVAQLNNGGVIRASPREKAERLLNRLAEETGGQVFSPKDLAELAQAPHKLNQYLSSQYIIGFDRQNKPGENGFRKVKVSISRAGAEKLVAITRPGYWAGFREPTQKDKK
ncbi:MAG: VWA domain-containing protein [Pyrinomonadaceae bacterium]|nr:VWA domain-containing protein [Pyrinomonadaceae bacterium]